MATPFHFLARERGGLLHLGVTSNGHGSLEAAQIALESSGLVVVRVLDSNESAGEMARQINRANGITEQGCTTCGG